MLLEWVIQGVPGCRKGGIAMKKRLAVIVVVLILCATAVGADDYKDTYVQLLQSGKYEELSQHLSAWERVDPDNPELYIAYFNYYYNLSREERILVLSPSQIDRIKPGEDIIKITDPEDPDKLVGYLYSEIVHDEEKIDLALNYLDEGLKRYPERLDMHLGKIFTLDQVSRYEAGKEALLEVLNLSAELDNRWLYHDGVPLADGYNFMIDNIQDWISYYFSLEDEKIYEYITEICQRMIELYPDCVYAYNDLGAVFYYAENYTEALKYFKLAAAYNPEDTIVLNNIAYLAKVTGDRETALEYYKKLQEYGNAEEKELAAVQIKALEEETNE